MRVQHKPSEEAEQTALFLMLAYDPRFEWVHAIPNGGHRHPATAARLKASGVRAGVWDVFVPLARGGYHGLYVEMKVKPNKLTEKQAAFGEYVKSQGYATAVCYSADEAFRVITEYAAEAAAPRGQKEG